MRFCGNKVNFNFEVVGELRLRGRRVEVQLCLFILPGQGPAKLATAVM